MEQSLAGESIMFNFSNSGLRQHLFLQYFRPSSADWPVTCPAVSACGMPVICL